MTGKHITGLVLDGTTFVIGGFKRQGAFESINDAEAAEAGVAKKLNFKKENEKKEKGESGALLAGGDEEEDEDAVVE